MPSDRDCGVCKGFVRRNSRNAARQTCKCDNSRRKYDVNSIRSESTVTSSSPAKHSDSSHLEHLARLDAMTKGVFTAATAGERASRVRDWLLTQPDAEQLASVFKDLSVKDKGAAKLVREKMDEARRAREQEAQVQEWAGKAQALLALAKLNIADAMAWQRDAAKAGAPLSKEPLAQLKNELSERVRSIEDLQHQVQVQREAAVLLAQRIEVLSTKPWHDAAATQDSLRSDVGHWQAQAAQLVEHAGWASVDAKFPPLLDASRAQLLVVWDAFQAALAQVAIAAADPQASLPPVPVWADELRAARGVVVEASVPAKPTREPVDPQAREVAQAAVREALQRLEAEIGEGHGKASAGAAAALRQALKDHGKLIDTKLDHQAHLALSAAGELEGWQRWRADQLREALLAQAEGLLKRPPGQAIGGRKMQESLRTLREQWKQTDQGGVPNHGLWRRFDEACNEAHKVVEGWLEKVKLESAEHKAQRLALIAEVQAWGDANRVALDGDWKGFSRVLHTFGDRWRDGGHIGEKAFAELQPQWKAALAYAAEPLEQLQAQSLVTRHAMIDEAKLLGAAPQLRVDAVKALQQRWQAEVHRVPMERRHEQKLWDAFRKPIDEAFNRKSAEREVAQTALSARDRVVLDAARGLEAANASGDAAGIRAAMLALDAALKGQALAQAEVAEAGHQERAAQQAVAGAQSSSDDGAVAGAPVSDAGAEAPVDAGAEGDTQAAPAPALVVAPKPTPKAVVAVRGDDRPGMKKEAPVVPGRAGKWNDRKDGGTRGAPDGRDGRGPRDGRMGGAARGDDRGRPGAWREDAPRLGDAAFRAQRDALEHAQAALRKLAAQAHGEALTHLLAAWEMRDPALLPNAQELGQRVTPATRSLWLQAVSATAPAALTKGSSPADALLRLEMAAEVPTPADHMPARRALQLQLLTRRNDPAPVQTWGQDAATVMAADFSQDAARRLQNAVKVLLKP